MAGLRFRDVDMVNRSLGDLGDSLLRERMRKDEASQRETARADRQREFDAEMQLSERRTAAAERSAAAQEGYRDALLKSQQAQQSIEQLRRAVGDIAGMHKAGQISTAEANRRVKMLQDGLRQGTDLILQEAGVADVNFQDIPADVADASDVEKDRTAAELERQAQTEADPAAKQVLLERAKALRSGIGRVDPTSFVTEIETIDPWSGGEPTKRRIRKYRADGQDGQSPIPSQPAGDVPEFDSEAAARAAGKNTGDIIKLKGVGKVRLK